MDFLARWVAILSSQGVIQRPLNLMQSCLLYADDTVFFFRLTLQQCTVLKLIFIAFQSITGLSLNSDKSDLVVIGANGNLIDQLRRSLGYRLTSLPIIFLGLPLSNKKLPKDAFLPIISKCEQRLSSWASSLLSMAGRLVLVHSCLSALPVYMMSVMELPRWVVSKIDKIRRDFLWKGGRDDRRKLVMASWNLVCTPKSVGGLGVIDLKTFNLCLLAKWLWKLWSPESSIYKSLFITQQVVDPDFNSFVLAKTFKSLVPILTTTTFFQLGNGALISLWNYNWGNGILRYQFPELFSFALNQHCSVLSCYQLGFNACFRQTISTSQAAQLQFSLVLPLVQDLTFDGSSDIPVWRFQSTGFTTASLYKFLKTRPTITSPFKHIWKLKVPPRVLTFTWLLLLDKLATIDNLQKRGW